MADLDTITLSELDAISELGNNDKILVESGGRMKRASSANIGGGGVYIFDPSEYEEPEPGGGVI